MGVALLVNELKFSVTDFMHLFFPSCYPNEVWDMCFLHFLHAICLYHLHKSPSENKSDLRHAEKENTKSVILHFQQGFSFWIEGYCC